MKLKLLTMAALCAIAFTANAQTKGTNTLGLGLNFNSSKSTSSQTENEYKNNGYSLGYGHFVKDNAKVTVELSYGENKYSNNNGSSVQNQKNYGGFIGYQKYFPLVKTFYAFAGARAGYTYGSGETNSISGSSLSINKANSYNLSAAGGLAWFVSKRFALETDLLSAGATYSKNTQEQVNLSTDKYTNTNKAFNLSSGGLFNNLGFKVYLLF